MVSANLSYCRGVKNFEPSSCGSFFKRQIDHDLAFELNCKSISSRSWRSLSLRSWSCQGACGQRFQRDQTATPEHFRLKFDQVAQILADVGIAMREFGWFKASRADHCPLNAFFCNFDQNMIYLIILENTEVYWYRMKMAGPVKLFCGNTLGLMVGLWWEHDDWGELLKYGDLGLVHWIPSMGNWSPWCRRLSG